jgi:fumarate hydratase class I
MIARRHSHVYASAHSTRLSLTGTIIVARDIAHAKLQERIDRGEGLPQYMKDHVVYYGECAKKLLDV